MPKATQADHIGHWSLWRSQQDGTLAELAKRWYGRYMAKHNDKRAEILKFWCEYGTGATCAAFHLNRSTLFRWQQRAVLGTLSAHSTAPTRKRTRTVDRRVVEQICRLREQHPGLGKDKLSPLLAGFCATHQLALPSASTIGRVLGDLQQRGTLPTAGTLRLSARTGRLLPKKKTRYHKTRRPKGYAPQVPGELLQLDTVVRHLDGKKRYVITAIDLVSRFAFALSFTSHGSQAAKRFFSLLTQVAPFTIQAIQTDNGSEWHGYFQQEAIRQQLTHYWNYPHFPKGNAFVERFNRTLSEEFLSWHRVELALDIQTCNQLLLDWLIWYNCDRPHHGLQQRSPLQYLNLNQQSQMYWTHTPA